MVLLHRWFWFGGRSAMGALGTERKFQMHMHTSVCPVYSVSTLIWESESCMLLAAKDWRLRCSA